ncbi:hypothetical protein, partial [Paraburkholderia sp. SIMBA_054]|uniref:hypothetical protein n=1 Tax=Paraburkholderia sp. SIMBA_054 TaxID=3085795 RepID=UPI0039792ED9
WQAVQSGQKANLPLPPKRNQRPCRPQSLNKQRFQKPSSRMGSVISHCQMVWKWLSSPIIALQS